MAGAGVSRGEKKDFWRIVALAGLAAGWVFGVLAILAGVLFCVDSAGLRVVANRAVFVGLILDAVAAGLDVGRWPAEFAELEIVCLPVFADFAAGLEVAVGVVSDDGAAGEVLPIYTSSGVGFDIAGWETERAGLEALVLPDGANLAAGLIIAVLIVPYDCAAGKVLPVDAGARVVLNVGSWKTEGTGLEILILPDGADFAAGLIITVFVVANDSAASEVLPIYTGSSVSFNVAGWEA